MQGRGEALVDQAEIHIRAGKGGDGCVSFRREKYVPRGGPDGGDGGDGGCVYAIATRGVDTLLDFSGRHHWKAGNGQPGMGKKMSGSKGADIALELPRGTLIYDRDTGVMLKDLSTYDERIVLAEGGKGGHGNTAFATAINRTPREAEPGTPPQERWLRLELKLIADVGLVGLPNAGKSTLLSRMSKAHPKVADYPFTTLKPQLGIVELPGHRRFVMADIPGLIEGAHEGAGLGDAFLRHIERTQTILHLVDCGSDLCPMAPLEAYRAIRKELHNYDAALEEKSELVIATKIDLTGAAEAAAELAQAIGKPVLAISAVTGAGLGELGEALWPLVASAKAAMDEEMDQPPQEAPSLPIPPHKRTV